MKWAIRRGGRIIAPLLLYVPISAELLNSIATCCNFARSCATYIFIQAILATVIPIPNDTCVSLRYPQ